MITDYSSLHDEIASWLDRTDLDSRIPTFIQLAEAEFRRKIQSMWQEKRATVVTIPGDKTIALPSDYNGIRTIKIYPGGNVYSLDVVTLDMLDAKYPTQERGIPVVYAIGDEQIFLGPTPEGEYTIEMMYYQFPSLSATQTTNAILEKYPDLYLYQSLTAAEGFLRNDPRIAIWKSLAIEAMAEIDVHNERLVFGDSPLEMRS